MTSRRAVAPAIALLLACGARSELSPVAPTPDHLSCGLTTVLARAGRGVELVAAVPPRLLGRVAWSVASGSASARVAPSGPDRARFITEEEGTYRVAVSAGPAEAERCEITVEVRGTAPSAICPDALVATASQPVTLVGEARSVAPVARARWRIEAVPSSSAHPPVTPLSERSASYVPDVVGEHIARFDVADAQGEEDHCVTRIRAVPGPGLRVELWWNPPGRQCPSSAEASCDRADLDLHLLRLGAAQGWGSESDCHFANCNRAAGQSLAWGASGADDDPALVRDDVAGHGPEVIVVPAPARGAYRVGVHYFDPRGADAQQAFVALYCDGAALTLGPWTLPSGGFTEGAFLSVAEATVGPEGCALRAIPQDGGAALVSWNDARGRAAP